MDELWEESDGVAMDATGQTHSLSVSSFSPMQLAFSSDPNKPDAIPEDPLLFQKKSGKIPSKFFDEFQQINVSSPSISSDFENQSIAGDDSVGVTVVQAPELVLGEFRLYKYRNYELNLLLPATWRTAKKLSQKDIFDAVCTALVCKSGTTDPISCEKCGKIVSITTYTSVPEQVGDGVEKYPFQIKSRCTSSKDHLNSTLILYVDKLPTDVPLVSRPFSVYARIKKSKKPSTPLQGDNELLRGYSTDSQTPRTLYLSTSGMLFSGLPSGASTQPHTEDSDPEIAQAWTPVLIPQQANFVPRNISGGSTQNFGPLCEPPLKQAKTIRAKDEPVTSDAQSRKCIHVFHPDDMSELKESGSVTSIGNNPTVIRYCYSTLSERVVEILLDDISEVLKGYGILKALQSTMKVSTNLYMVVSCYRSAKEMELGVSLTSKYLQNELGDRQNLFGKNIYHTGLLCTLGDVVYAPKI